MQKSEKKSENYISSKRVAVYLDLTHETVNRWLREGILNGTKVGKHWRIRESELMKFLATVNESQISDCEASENKKQELEMEG